MAIAITLVAAACAGADTTTTIGDAPDQGTTSPPGATTTTSAEAGGGEGEALTATPAGGWSSTFIGTGIKPVLDLDSSGSPAVAYLEERLSEGFVAYAAAAEGWAVDLFVEGYFYGPIGLAFDGEDRPNIVWHDHQADQFDLELGDLTYAVRDGGDWAMITASHDGHDGWDSTIAIGSDGVVRAAGIDPAQFDRTDGVEYYELRDGSFVVEAIGTGPIVYEFNVGLAIGADGVPVVSYYDHLDQSLRFGRRTEAGWDLVTIDDTLDSGKYSDVALDDQGRAHISYLIQTGANSGTIGYAVEDGSGGWVREDVGEITDLETGHFGARRVTSIDLVDGSPHIAFSDKSGIWVASRTDAGWSVDQVLTAGSLVLGQLVSLEIDQDGTHHIAYWEHTADDMGLIGYLTNG